MDVIEYISAVEAEGKRFAAAADAGDLSVPIDSCPNWDMADLVRHLGMIHLWAAANVAFPESDWLDVDELPDLVKYWPDLTGATGEYPPDHELVEWYRRTLDNLVDVLRSAPPDVEAFTFLPAPTPLTMWARRQASEIAIHRVDAEHARNMASTFEPSFAADMLDELLTGFAPRPGRPIDVDAPKVVHVRPTDVDAEWYVTIGRENVETSRCGDGADLIVTGTASDLYTLLWNRTPASDIATTGDAGLVDLWHQTFRVRWS